MFWVKGKLADFFYLKPESSSRLYFAVLFSLFWIFYVLELQGQARVLSHAHIPKHIHKQTEQITNHDDKYS